MAELLSFVLKLLLHINSIFKKFKDNVAYLRTSNNDASKPYKLSVNQFADLTNEEFIASRNKFKGHEHKTTFKYENVTYGNSTSNNGSEEERSRDTYQGQTPMRGVDQDCEGRLMDDAFQFIQHHGISAQFQDRFQTKISEISK
ncbi:hypothetical protein DVH24_020919 [Malus domestica]|uniref:Cathepsin propeptide inhibitor domain-containing protein n=1 Tax=Malus domestica TaxID=3750 RepID=A0A498J9S4_MALDO|nr:hypothetical protein DVH24_020919 [Malus domestica]